jgi:hypothetical protein
MERPSYFQITRKARLGKNADQPETGGTEALDFMPGSCKRCLFGLDRDDARAIM